MIVFKKDGKKMIKDIILAGGIMTRLYSITILYQKNNYQSMKPNDLISIFSIKLVKNT
jgi:hypothetical protein